MNDLDKDRNRIKSSSSFLYKIKKIPKLEDLDVWKNILNYSSFKYGNKESIELFASLLVKQIRDDLNITLSEGKEENFLLSFPSLAQIPPVHALGEEIAKQLKLKIAPIIATSPNELNVVYGRMNSFKERHENRKQNDIKVSLDKDQFKDKEIIFIDDAITSGATALNVEELFMNLGARKFHIHTIFSIDSENSSLEDVLNNQFLEISGLEAFIDILNNDDTIISRNTLQSIYDMPKEDLKVLFSGLNLERKQKIVKLLKKYYGERMNQLSLKIPGIF